MKKLITYLREYISEDYHRGLYGYTALFLTLTISLNYYFDFEDSVLDSYFRQPVSYLYYSSFFAFAYYGVAIPVLWVREPETLQNPHFWLKSSAFLVLLGAGEAVDWHYTLSTYFDSVWEAYYFRKLASKVKRFVLWLPAMYLLIRFYRDTEVGLYGLRWKAFDPRPYLWMLLGMLPLIITASFLPDFLRTYPIFKFWRYQPVFGLNPTEMFLWHELFYGASFLTVELMFRGALVIGMAPLLGRHVVLPMVATYAFLHFGKPAGETISSIFGGYILGVISWRTQNLLGGCIVHIGIAWLMNAAAYVQLRVLG